MTSQNDRKLIQELSAVLVLKLALVWLLWFLFFRDPVGGFGGETDMDAVLFGTPASESGTTPGPADS